MSEASILTLAQLLSTTCGFEFAVTIAILSAANAVGTALAAIGGVAYSGRGAWKVSAWLLASLAVGWAAYQRRREVGQKVRQAQRAARNQVLADVAEERRLAKLPTEAQRRAAVQEDDDVELPDLAPEAVAAPGHVRRRCLKCGLVAIQEAGQAAVDCHGQPMADQPLSEPATNIPAAADELASKHNRHAAAKPATRLLPGNAAS